MSRTQQEINPVRASASFVAKNARHVLLHAELLASIAEEWVKKGVQPPSWHNDVHYRTPETQKMLDFLFLLDTLQSCFWPYRKDEQKWGIKHRGILYSGYYALAVALKIFFEKNPEKANLRYFSGISYSEFSEMLQGRGVLQFMPNRWKMAQEVSKKIVEKYGTSEVFVRGAEHRLSTLIPKIVHELPWFDDTAVYRGRKVYFYKRAQILAADIQGAFGGKGIGAFADPEYPTAFADYKLPQILEAWGIFEYTLKLRKKICERKKISSGSPEEIEIRALTVQAVELLRCELMKLGKDFLPYEIDWILWNESKKRPLPVPHHRTRTYFY